MRLADGRLLLQTVDFFTPIVDDPYDFGRIAAANSLSDIYAMGGQPLFALNIVGFPINELPHATLTAILQGGIDKAREAGIAIVGGHSIDDKEPKYGLVVTGEVQEDQLLANSGARPGDRLILTKPLGTGIIATAIKRGVAHSETIAAATEVMGTLNNHAADAARIAGAHAVTDITGFGLLGHLAELCRASGVSTEIDFDALRFLPQTEELLKQNILPGGTRRNLEYATGFTRFADHLSQNQRLLAADAQTSGGLLVAVNPADATRFQNEFQRLSGQPPMVIGELVPTSDPLITVH